MPSLPITLSEYLVLAGVFIGGVVLGWWLGRRTRPIPTLLDRTIPLSELALPEAVCGRNDCASLRDPRCVGLNCTRHCQHPVGCNGICLVAVPVPATRVVRVPVPMAPSVSATVPEEPSVPAVVARPTQWDRLI